MKSTKRTIHDQNSKELTPALPKVEPSQEASRATDTVVRRRRLPERSIKEMTPAEAEALRDYRDAALVQIGCRVPADLHELAQEIAFDERSVIKGGVGAVYTGLLHLLATDKEIEQRLRRFIRA